MSAPLALADRIHVRGRTTDRVQNVAPMEVEHAKVDRAGPVDDVALEVDDHVRERDPIFTRRRGRRRAGMTLTITLGGDAMPGRGVAATTWGRARHARRRGGRTMPKRRAGMVRRLVSANQDTWLDQLRRSLSPVENLRAGDLASTGGPILAA